MGLHSDQEKCLKYRIAKICFKSLNFIPDEALHIPGNPA